VSRDSATIELLFIDAAKIDIDVAGMRPRSRP